MRRFLICIFIVVWPSLTKANTNNAAEYFRQGLESSMTYKKIEYFTKAIELNPNLSDAYVKRGMLYYFQEKYDEMIRDFKTYIELVPATAEAYRMLGVGYHKVGLFKEAVSSLTRAIEKDPDLAGAYAVRAEVYLSMGEYEKAIRDSTRAIDIWGDPQTMADAYRTRAKVNWEIGDGNAFYEDNRTALYLDPKSWIIAPGSRWGGSAPLKTMRRLGLFYFIGITFVMIFKLTLKPPGKED